MSGGAYATGPLPPAGWIYDPTTMQTRWWDGARWTEHVLPTAPKETAVYGFNPRARPTSTSANGPAKASLILILIQLLGGLVFVGLTIVFFTMGAQFWGFLYLLNALGWVSIVSTIAAFVLAIIGTVIAVRRPTRKREAVFALVFSSLLILWMVARLVMAPGQFGPLEWG
ncbi:DUF2510 domain-containing protein [Microbacterium sp. E-13]|uniref:DUF2510 domain-containing protein n=1 Tax=Microbacterium sp. E-13 TaxID=3404048 RepID=UPI003CEC3184